MQEMKYILSWGGGVNSTAMLAMIKLGMLPLLNKDNTHIIFADTGAEMPYTHEHTSNCLQPMIRDGWLGKCISPHNKGWEEMYSSRCRGLGLPEYCIEKKVMPSRTLRWCTMEYKSKPIRKYREGICSSPKMWDREVVILLGIANDETKRAKFLGYNHTMYPLIDAGIDRQGCLDLCEKADLPKPRKSGCYLCPFQGKVSWLELYNEYPDYFNKVEEIENTAREKYGGDAYYFVRDIPIRKQIEKWLSKQEKDCRQQELFAEYRHCLCEL